MTMSLTWADYFKRGAIVTSRDFICPTARTLFRKSPQSV